MRSCVARIADLDSVVILSPERYTVEEDRFGNGIALQDLTMLSKASVSPKAAASRDLYVADTTHAEHGILKVLSIRPQRIKSAKKLIRQGDVLISRLRPYLRQVALVDKASFQSLEDFCCSTEFYVLRSIDSKSISFLVPWLLSGSVQKVLEESVEGAHHPRFSPETLLRLRVPQALVDERESVSRKVEQVSKMYNDQYSLLDNLILELD